MKRLLRIALLIVLLAAGAADAEVRLLLDEPSILPGTPTGLTVVVTNPGKTALQLPPALWLVATTEDVRTFRVSAYGLSDTAAITIEAAERMIPAGETREFRFDPSPVLVGSAWFTDGRLSAPGTYRLRAVFAPSVEPNGEFSAANALASKEELLTVAAESPDDVAVWEWMRARGRGKWGQGEWMSEPFAEFVMKNHPNSGYALYAVIFQPRDETSPNLALAEQAARFPQKSYSDQLRLVLAQYHQQAADILRHSNVQSAAEQADAARKLAADLASRSRSRAVRAAAQRLLTTIPKREAFLQ